MRIEGTDALVTGAGAGIGRATALALAGKGARVVVTDVDGAAAEATAKEIGAPATALELDVTDADAVASVAAEHPVDIVVANAGVGMSGRFTDMELDDWRWIRAVNLDGVVHTVHAFGPAMLARRRGHAVIVSSGLGYLGGYIEALGKPGCTVVLASPCPDTWDMEHHPSYRDVWDRVLPETRDPYEIMARFEGEFTTHAGYIDRYRNGVAFHPVHGILATHPLRRLKHASRVIVAGADDPAVPARLGFDAAPTVQDAIRMAEDQQGHDCSIACVN